MLHACVSENDNESNEIIYRHIDTIPISHQNKIDVTLFVTCKEGESEREREKPLIIASMCARCKSM